MFLYLNKFLELIPLASSVLFITLFAITDGGLFHNSYTPAISAIFVFYWFFANLGLMGTLTIFFIGFYSDVMFLNPIGIESFSLLIAYYITRSQKELCSKYGFLAFWLFFGYFLFIFFFFKFILLSIFVGSVNFIGVIFSQYLFTFFLYPIIHYMFSFFKLKKITFIRI
ncbi:MAG: rod shape-determining protein MreD [Rickettsiales bacterium]|nr:rod shape-determining protein MreD [Rickettsiales bacterium]